MRRMRARLAVAVLPLVLAACAASTDDEPADADGLGMDLEEPPYNDPHPLVPAPCFDSSRAACSDSAGVLEGDCYEFQLDSCSTDTFLRGYPTSLLPSCDADWPIVPIDKHLSVELYRSASISDTSASEHTLGLQRYYEPHGLWLTTPAPPQAVEIRYAIDWNWREFTDALVSAGIDPTMETLSDDDGEVIDQIVPELLFGPTRDFVQRHSHGMATPYQIVIVERVLSPAAAALLKYEGIVVGLGLSPLLLDRVDAEEPTSRPLNTLLNLGEDFTPTLFIGHVDISRLTGSFDLVIAHEMGHALGLPHVLDEGNLMEQGGSQGCRRWLSEEQVSLMGPFDDRPAVAAASTALRAAPQLSLARRAFSLLKGAARSAQ